MRNYFECNDPSNFGLLPLAQLRQLRGQIVQLRDALEVVTLQPIFDSESSLQLDWLVQTEEELSEWVRHREHLGGAAA